ncbi:MAG: FAM174 family membrane protein [Planctomycetes bacterium]|nr:FAM174 family membrane protein [Planctomycetota bacterium]
MNGWHFSWNLGMVAAAALLVVGGALMVLPREDQPTLRTAGFGIVVMSGVVYFVARVVQMIQERRK